MLTVLSLFSGIGAFEKALSNLGIAFELVGFAETDKFAAKSYCLIHGVDQSLNLGDVRLIEPESFTRPIDLITYGFPCTDFSLLGSKRGLKTSNGQLTNSGLFYEALRLIKSLQPKIALAENVKALTAKRFESEFREILHSLEKANYRNFWQVLNAKDYGTPQNRERIFILSVRNDIAPNEFVFPLPVPLFKSLRDVLETEVPEKYFLSEKLLQGFSEKVKRRTELGFKFSVSSPDDICRCITSNYHKYPISGCYLFGNLDCFSVRRLNRVYDPNGAAPTLTTMQGGYSQPKIYLGKV